MAGWLDDDVLTEKVEHYAGLTNADVLSDVERSRATQLRLDSEDYLFSLKSEIQELASLSRRPSGLDGQLKHMLETHEYMATRIRRLDVALAPHKRLPPEILGEIFVYCVGGRVIQFPSEPSKAIWVLGRVCRRWRDVMWTDPNLWSRIHIDVPACNRTSFNAVRRLLSSKVTSFIAVRCYDDRSLSAHNHLFYLFSEIPSESFSSLTSLSLNIEDSLLASNINIVNSEDVLKQMERLMKLEVDPVNPRVFSTIIQLGVPLAQLTELNLAGWALASFSTVHSFLQQCQNLETFIAALGQDAWPRDFSAADCRLLKLSFLKLNIQNDLMFQILHVPALRELHLSGDLAFPNVTLSSMIERSQCHLETLVYDGEYKAMSYSIQDLHRFFEIVPSLKSLSTFFLVLRQKTLHSIALGTLLPCLEAVQIRVDSPGAFVHLIETRLEGKFIDNRRIAVISEARGYYVRLLHGHALGIDTAYERLQELNKEHGTNFMIHEE